MISGYIVTADCVDGILCKRDGMQFYAFNPRTKKWDEDPNLISYFMGYDSCRKVDEAEAKKLMEEAVKNGGF